MAPGDGKAILLLPDPIAAIELKITSRPAAKGEKISFVCEVKDGKKRTIPTVLPIAIELAADNGLRLPGSGFYAAENGKLEIKEILPTNLSSSVKNLILTAKCLSSGKKAAIKISLQ